LEFTGLTSSEALKREVEGLSNKASKPRTKTYSEIIIENVFSLFNFIIFGIIAFVLFFYFQNKDHRLLLDSIGILSIALINTFIALFQEIRSKVALDKVSLLLKKQVNVIRDGNLVPIDVEKIVVDDIIQIIRGNQIAVDGTVVESNHLEIDESLLTGESLPILKQFDNEILSGSFCVSGNGFYKAVKVGENSYANSVTTLAKKYKFILTPLQKKINLILKILFLVALILVLIEVITWNVKTNLPPGLQSVEFVRRIATILISLVPQGLVLLSSVSFALGIYRISKIGAIIQKLNAIESFANVQVVCMDKTGTLTENKLSVHSVFNLHNEISEKESKLLLGTYARLSSDKNATIRAVEQFEFIDEAESLSEFPFSSINKFSVLKIKTRNKTECFIFGAYDILAERVSSDYRNNVNEIFEKNNLKIYRNLLFGKIRNITKDDVTEIKLADITIEPISLVSITDTVRADVFDALKLFQNYGIEFKILSGDTGEAISALLKDIGWDIDTEQIINGKRLDELDDKEFEKTILTKSVFGRLKPEHKLRIIKVLRKNKIYTAMIGDGVNDLPAIKQADMGIAMEDGSEITKEVADIVLLKNKFSLLPQIFDEGNKIVNTVNSVSKLFLTKNFIVIYLSILSLIFMLDFPLTPRRVSLLNIFAIGLPAFILTLKNKNTAKCVNFSKDVFSFVIISSAVIISAGYMGEYLATKFYTTNRHELELIMISIMIFISIANFIIVAIESGGNKGLFYFYGIILLFIYFILSVIPVNLPYLRFVKIFYEITTINPNYWIPILSISILSSIILFFLHRIRDYFVTVKK
jgi:cation-transporting P-type ATPase E